MKAIKRVGYILSGIFLVAGAALAACCGALLMALNRFLELQRYNPGNPAGAPGIMAHPATILIGGVIGAALGVVAAYGVIQKLR